MCIKVAIVGDILYSRVARSNIYGFQALGAKVRVAGPRTLLPMGNEALGVSREVLEQCDRIVEIPLFGFKNSMNVAAAAAVITFEILRQWKVQPEPGERHGAT